MKIDLKKLTVDEILDKYLCDVSVIFINPTFENDLETVKK